MLLGASLSIVVGIADDQASCELPDDDAAAHVVELTVLDCDPVGSSDK